MTKNTGRWFIATKFPGLEHRETRRTRQRNSFITLILVILFQNFASAGSQTNTTTVLRLLDTATAMAQRIKISDEIVILFVAADVAATLDPERANTWSIKAFRLAQQLEPAEDNRLPMEKNALRVLSINDPDTAMALYRQQESPLQFRKPGEQLSEDPRALSVPSVFSVVWEKKGRAYLDQLQSLAAYLGETGQYPYRALGKIAADVGKSDPKRARSILRDAIKFYRSDHGVFATTNEEFVEFILETHAVATPAILRAELNALLRELEHPRVSFPTQSSFRLSVTTPKGNALFTSETDLFLYRLMPLIKLDNTQRATKLLSTHTDLRKAPKIKIDTPIVVDGAVSLMGTASDERMRKALDRHRVMQVSQLAASDPAEALAVADQISDLVLRDLALVAIAPSYQQINARRADDFLQSATKHLATMPSDLAKLQLTVALIKANVTLHRIEAARVLFGDAFRSAQQIVAEDLRQHPDRPAYALQGFDELNQLFEADVAIESAANVETRLAAFQNPVLRASLTISAARAIRVQP